MKLLIYSKEKIKIEIVQRNSERNIHVTSNPLFAFHDDVFPRFAKNTVKQLRFPPLIYQKTIIPESINETQWFSSLHSLNHISTIEMKLRGKEVFQLKLKLKKSPPLETKNLEAIFFDGTSLFILGTYKNGTIWIASDYLKTRLQFNVTDEGRQKSSAISWHKKILFSHQPTGTFPPS